MKKLLKLAILCLVTAERYNTENKRSWLPDVATANGSSVRH